jgi:YgiT-type zinc finger domain-containing protein
MKGRNSELARCSVCNSTVRAATISYLQARDDGVYLITGVPAGVCSQCGEQYLSPDTVNTIRSLFERELRADLKSIPTLAFPAGR